MFENYKNKVTFLGVDSYVEGSGMVIFDSGNVLNKEQYSRIFNYCRDQGFFDGFEKVKIQIQVAKDNI